MRGERIIRSCKGCGMDFATTKERNETHCSRKCRHAATRAESVCSYCGKKEIVQTSHVRPYCSADCATLARYGDKKQKICKGCGIRFSGPANRSYCSNDCREQSIEAAKVEMRCEYCNIEFKTDKNRFLAGRKYCSRHCRHLDMIGEKGANWQGGMKNRNPEERLRSAKNRRARESQAQGSHTRDQFVALCKAYDNRCLACGRNDVALTEDHVTPLSKGGTNSIDNIQPLCRSCNSKKHLRRVDYRTKIGQIKTWIQLKLID